MWLLFFMSSEERTRRKLFNLEQGRFPSVSWNQFCLHSHTMLSSHFIAGLILVLQALDDMSLKKLSTKSTLTCAAAVLSQLFVTAVSFLWKKILFSFCFLSFSWFPTSRIIKYFTLFSHSNGLVPHHGSSRCLCCAPEGSMSLYKGNIFEKDYILPEHASFFAYIFGKRNQLGIVSHNGTAMQYRSYILGFYPCFIRGSTCRGIIYNVKAK